MFRRPAALFAATLLDYLAWRISAGSGLQLLGLISGLLLLPLLIGTIALTAVALLRRAAEAPSSRSQSSPGLRLAAEQRPERDEAQDRLAA